MEIVIGLHEQVDGNDLYQKCLMDYRHHHRNTDICKHWVEVKKLIPRREKSVYIKKHEKITR